ncbi:phosphatidylinositol 3,4,5-trisphosphate 3-phosphatase TPTE2-like isoform X2 [Dipodomys merriami]|uniref:phosphatidylinositol 3,4,5-trisphosphate 3-phosphatase TPTE2-like isoform X2 n=1 Tax=Dipodomys merriami TaxID=94247 RepID=UPI0038559DFE
MHLKRLQFHHNDTDTVLAVVNNTTGVDLSEVLPVPLLGIVDDEPCPYELCSIPDSESILLSDSTMESVEEDRSKCDPKKILRFIMTSLPFRILGILLFLTDLVLMVVDILVSQSEDYIPFQYRVTSLGISLFFLIEVLLQIYVDGKKHYFLIRLTS